MNEAKRERIAYIDAMKGIGIILVCLGHTLSRMTIQANKIILSFHMPLFFFVCGMLFYGKNYDKESVGSFAGRKARSILSPQITLCLMNVSTQIILDCILTKDALFTQINFVKHLLSWFLIVLFLTDLICWVLFKFMKEQKKLTVLFFTLVVIAFFIVDYNKIIYVQQMLVSLIFAVLGYIARPYADRYYKTFKNKGIGLFLILVCAAMSMYNEPIGMYINQYGNKIMFILTAIMGIFAIIDLACFFENSPIILLFGKNSIIVYVTHFSALRFIKGIENMLGLTTHELPYYVMTFLLLILTEIIVIFLAKKYVPFLFGIKKEGKMRCLKTTEN